MMPSELRVLVVEDDVVAARTLVRILTKSGHQCQSAQTVRQAKTQAEVWQPQVILIDRHLPDGDGIALARSLRTGVSYPRLVLLSGDPATASERQSFDASLLKPVSVEALLASLSE